MEKATSPELNEVQALYDSIVPFTQEGMGMGARRIVSEWNPKLMEDTQTEAETMMLLQSMDVSDRYLYGFFTCTVAAKFENGGTLPELTAQEYEWFIDGEQRAELTLTDDDAKQEYFCDIQTAFYEKFPITSNLLGNLENILITTGFSETEIEVGFTQGWYKAQRLILPLL